MVNMICLTCLQWLPLIHAECFAPGMIFDWLFLTPAICSMPPLKKIIFATGLISKCVITPRPSWLSAVSSRGSLVDTLMFGLVEAVLPETP